MPIMNARSVLPDCAMFESREAYQAAQERGRALAAEAMRTDPDARARVEAKYGADFCSKRYPEAYGRGPYTGEDVK